MRTSWLVIALAVACSPSAPAVVRETGARFVSIGVDALPAARAIAAQHGRTLEVLERDDDVAVISFEAGDLDALSYEMHAHYQRCGGFELHDSLDDARASLHTLDVPPRPALDYTLDRAEAVRSVLPALDPSAIHGTIGELSAMKNRYYQSATGAAASVWLRDRWRSFTTRPDVTVELVDHGYAQKSVILTIPGSTRADEVVVLGGHLDSIALGGKASKAPGADDDASGIATLTEIARALLARNFHPARTVQLIAYAAEEVGLRGSLSIARDYKKRGINVVGVLQLDMTNYQGSDRDIWLMKDFTSEAQNAFLIRLIETYVGATWGLDACGYACSDHAAWYRAGVPASMPFESRMADRNRTIHTGADTLETSGNNAAHALKFARLGAAFAIELGKGEVSATATIAAPHAGGSQTRWLVLGVLALGLALARRATRRAAL